MKKLIALLLAFSMLFAFAACGEEEETDTTTVDPTVNVTIPEGYTVLEIAELLETSNVCSAVEFLNACNTVPAGYEDLLSGSDTEGRVFLLEGYLFPDTYNFYKGSSVSTVIDTMLKNTLSKLTDTYYDRATELGYTMDEVLTFASVIQGECSISSEMANVSAVFHNRLENSGSFPYIGSDVTRHYIEDEVMERYISQTGMDYDTLFGNYCTNDSYDLKTSGLPIGPINNPGLSAIEAALYPGDTDALYFFTDPDGNFHYNSSFSAHQSEYYSCLNEGSTAD